MAHIANRDIWSEVLRYFQISFVDDSVEDIHLKRRAMFSAALTCTDLTETALDGLWRSMTTLEPLSRVLNASSTSPTGIFQYQGQGQDQGYWDITASADELNSCASRLPLYLSRIHYLHLASPPNRKELVLWKALLSLGRISSLCPNLKELFLDLDKVIPGLIHDLSPLISNSAERIIFANSRGASGEVAASLLLRMFRHYDAKVLEVSYEGFISTRIFHHIFEFPSLRAATLRPLRSNDPIGRSYPTSFHSPSHLVTLDLHYAFSEEAGLAFGRWLAGLEALSTLRLCGSWSEIRKCVFNQRTFHSVRRLSLIFTFSSEPETSDRRISAALFHLISSTFPNLDSIRLEVQTFNNYAWNSEITIQDIMKLKGKLMESIDLHRISITLSTADFISIIDTWHTLKQLSIVPVPMRGDSNFEADLILSHISTYGTRLRKLSVPLDLSSLSAASWTATLPPPRCPLQRLELVTLKNLPLGLQGKHLLALNLLHLFPLLAVITSRLYSSHVGDLQVIIRAFQDILASPPKKLSSPI